MHNLGTTDESNGQLLKSFGKQKINGHIVGMQHNYDDICLRCQADIQTTMIPFISVSLSLCLSVSLSLCLCSTISS